MWECVGVLCGVLYHNVSATKRLQIASRSCVLCNVSNTNHSTVAFIHHTNTQQQPVCTHTTATGGWKHTMPLGLWAVMTSDVCVVPIDEGASGGWSQTGGAGRQTTVG